MTTPEQLGRSGVVSSRDTPSTRAAIQRIPSAPRYSVFVRYGSALVLPLAALAVTMALAPYLQNVIFIFFWPAVVGAAIVGGLGPAFTASALSVLLADYFLVAPLYQLDPTNPTEVVPFIVFLITSFLVGTLTNNVQSERRRAAEAAEENAQLATTLEEQALELEQQLEESQSLQEELEASSEELVERTAEAEAADKFSRSILSSISDPFIVQDADWRFRYINEAAEKVFLGSNKGDSKSLTGKRLWDVYPEIVGTVFEKEMKRAAKERVPVTFEGFYRETGQWAMMFSYPLPDGGLATQWKNITAVKKAEEAANYLVKASDTLASSLDYETTLSELARLVVPEFADWAAIEIVGNDGVPKQVAVAHVNPEKVRWAYELNKRYPPDPSAPTGVYNVLRTGQPEFYPEIPEEMLRAGAMDDEHLKIILELGFKSAMVVPLIAHDKTLGAMTLVTTTSESGRRYTPSDLDLAVELARRAALAVDNARLHKAELEARQAAEAANLAKTQFLAVMSHELRTPLNAIAGYAELMRMGIRGPVTAEQQADLERIKRSQRNLLSLINDVLNYAKLEAGHIEFDSQKILLHSFLADIESLVTPQLQGKGLKYEYDECDGELAVTADEEKMRQIMVNLLSNAIKFTPAGGLITINCDISDGVVTIKVTDTGVGIPDDKINAIFEPFIQLDRKLTSTHEGTGLGLSISRDLARGMGGELTAESVPGKGSTFSLTLPRAV
ncbi:MAG TPA: ATP-binding protein [Gemmatimonadaceae bacterium]|nr:ATP-binding protein [Gemmatimonadaceae bacterium]